MRTEGQGELTTSLRDLERDVELERVVRGCDIANNLRWMSDDRILDLPRRGALEKGSTRNSCGTRTPGEDGP